MIKRSFWKELLGFNLYQTESGKLFYAWSSKKAITKYPNKTIYYITNNNKKIKLRGLK